MNNNKMLKKIIFGSILFFIPGGFVIGVLFLSPGFLTRSKSLHLYNLKVKKVSDKNENKII